MSLGWRSWDCVLNYYGSCALCSYESLLAMCYLGRVCDRKMKCCPDPPGPSCHPWCLDWKCQSELSCWVSDFFYFVLESLMHELYSLIFFLNPSNFQKYFDHSKMNSEEKPETKTTYDHLIIVADFCLVWVISLASLIYLSLNIHLIVSYNSKHRTSDEMKLEIFLQYFQNNSQRATRHGGKSSQLQVKRPAFYFCLW